MADECRAAQRRAGAWKRIRDRPLSGPDCAEHTECSDPPHDDWAGQGLALHRPDVWKRAGFEADGDVHAQADRGAHKEDKYVEEDQPKLQQGGPIPSARLKMARLRRKNCACA